MRVYQFTEDERSYLLILNGRVYNEYSKNKFSKQDAETAASKTVEGVIKKHGIQKVEYDGCICC